ncbi:MAG: hypothetical protein LIR50_07455 [Bacillota bacterium]|nr:hypothetical protein [Bacillota bacterium]
MSERALAHIEQIVDIQPIPEADKIEVATVLGWKVVIAKADNFHVGDKVVYIEIDSKVPERPEFEFLRDRKFRVRTIRLRGQYSQGLIMPMKILGNKDYDVGTDVTKELGITYYIPEDNVRKADKVPKSVRYQSMAARHKELFKKQPFRWLMKREWGRRILFMFFGKKKDNPKSFPTKFVFVHKTDETRIEALPWLLGYDKPLIVTEKLDGTSSTYILERIKKNKFEFWVTSRNIRQLDDDQDCYHDYNIYWAMARKYNIEAHLREYLEKHPDLQYVCVQGESVGSVQGNPLKLQEDDLYIFNFIDSARGRISSVEGKDIIESWGMKWVPILDTSFMMPSDMEEFKVMATAKSVVNPKVLREGIVLRDPTCDLSFKNVSREFLMKHQDDMME